MSRKRLPDRRAHWTQKIRMEGTTCHLSCGEYEDGSLGEIFLAVSKAGSAMRAMLEAFAINFSISLQSGTPLKDLISTHRGVDFQPQGVVVGDFTQVKKATSIIDYVMQELEKHYVNPPSPTSPPAPLPLP